jgi:lipopolysaccharide transport system ATP-binding protein
VGTGFHPELSGRENIFLNGVILGMSRNEVLSKLEEIIDFSGVEKFIDTPLKHYSSGMQLRLAFAVAAFLEPEILIIDEVLAVGDAEFQKKCIGKMQDVTKNGRTVLFVSHNLAALQALCSKCVLLSAGTVKMIDTTPKVIREYLVSDSSTSFFNQEYDKGLMITQIKSQIDRNEIIFDFEIFSDGPYDTSLDIRIKDQLKNPVGFGSLGALNKAGLLHITTGENRLSVKFMIDQLANGTYYFSFDLTNPDIEYYFRLEDVNSM